MDKTNKLIVAILIISILYVSTITTMLIVNNEIKREIRINSGILLERLSK